MARHKTLSDDDLADRLLPAVMTLGPEGLTFAQAAAHVGLSQATLVQRFRSRDGMIQAVLLRAWDQLDRATEIADRTAGDGIDGARSLLLSLTAPERAEADLTDGLRLLREDVRNPVLRDRGRAWGERLARALGRRLHDDPGTGTALGWQMLQVWQGALIWWAFTRMGDCAAYVSRALEEWAELAGRPH